MIEGSACLDGKVSASLDVVSGEPQDSVLGLLLFIVYTSKVIRIVGNHIVGYAGNTTIYMQLFLDRTRVLK